MALVPRREASLESLERGGTVAFAAMGLVNADIENEETGTCLRGLDTIPKMADLFSRRLCDNGTDIVAFGIEAVRQVVLERLAGLLGRLFLAPVAGADCAWPRCGAARENGTPSGRPSLVGSPSASSART
jgi:hypothetical protein